MLDRKMLRLYLKYVVPSTLAFLLESIYCIVDGLFVGQATGDAGLAGVNVAWPLVALVLAAGTGIGMGGAVISSIREGEGHHDKARATMAHTLLLLALATIPLMVILLPFGHQLLVLMGGRGDTLAQANDYLSVIGWGVVFQVLAAGCIPLIRNKGKVFFALAIMGVGGLLNCMGDYVFVFHIGWGVQGAALATVLSQVFVFVCGIWFFMRPANRFNKTDFHLEGTLVLRTLKLGFAPFALTLLPELTTLVMNITTVEWGGETAQAAFAVISYSAVALQMVIQGIGDGAQPLISKCFGAGDGKTVHTLRRTNYVVAIGIAVIGTLVLWGLRPQMAALFGISPQATELFYNGMFLFGFVFVFYGFTHVTTSFFYAVENSACASTIIIGEAVFIVAFAWILPQFLGMNGVWLIVVATQILLCMVGAVLLLVSEKRLKQRTDAEYRKGVSHASIEEMS